MLKHLIMYTRQVVMKDKLCPWPLIHIKRLQSNKL